MVWLNSHLPAPRMLVHRDFYERINRPLRSCEELACVLLVRVCSITSHFITKVDHMHRLACTQHAFARLLLKADVG